MGEREVQRLLPAEREPDHVRPFEREHVEQADDRVDDRREGELGERLGAP
jgi:hypothetical protein